MINRQNNKPDSVNQDTQKTTQPDPDKAPNKEGVPDDTKKNAGSDLKGFAAIKAKEEAIKVGAAQAR